MKPPGMRETAGVNQIFGADVFFIRGITIRVEYAAIIFEELFGNFLAARHLEVEDHTHAGALYCQK